MDDAMNVLKVDFLRKNPFPCKYCPRDHTVSAHSECDYREKGWFSVSK